MRKEISIEGLVELANELGYVVLYMRHTDYGPRLEITPNREKEYVPEIYYEDIDFSFGEEEFAPHWTIQTTSYGALAMEDIKLFIEAYQNARVLVALLNEIDISKLEEYSLQEKECQQ